MISQTGGGNVLQKGGGDDAVPFTHKCLLMISGEAVPGVKNVFFYHGVLH